MTSTMYLPVRLRFTDRAALQEHFLSLDAQDRRLRFGASLSDEGIRQLDERIDFDRDELFGVVDDELRLLGVVHVAFYPDKAELGLSVLPAARGLGLGNALFARAVMHLINRNVHEVFVHCLGENGAMMHLARKNGMRVVREGTEVDAYLALPSASAGSYFTEWVHDQNANAAHAVRRQSRIARSIFAIFAPAAR